MHNANQVLMGASQFSGKEVTAENGDPASFPAGVAVRRTGTPPALSLTTGELIGISLGATLSKDAKKTAVLRCGLRVPLRLTDNGVKASLVKDDLTFTAKEKGAAGNDITIAYLDTGGAGDEEVTVEGTDIIISGESEVSTAQQIADALLASEEAMALIDVEVAEGEGGSAQTAFVEDALENGADSFPYAVPGAALYVHDTTGYAIHSDSGDAVATGGSYASGPMKGIDPDTGALIDVAVVDLGGGL